MASPRPGPAPPLGHRSSDDFGLQLEEAASALQEDDMLLSGRELTLDNIHNLSSACWQ